uniref:G-protein coupled receptors family 1 profile domain-containing protein n=1 Tax=Plectus sambesii TaxID=2011161 RepID=A0A914VYJ3_9BILA
MEANESGFMDPCQVPANDRRFYLIAICGTSFSIVSCLENVIICYALLAKRKHRNSHFLYLALLAFSDGFLSFCYGPVIAMDIIKNYVKLLWLTRVWWYYVGPMLALCHVAMAWSCYLIILATIERYLVTTKAHSLNWVRTNRIKLIICSLIAALISKGTFIFEVELVQNGNCTGLTEFKPTLAAIVHNYFYGTIFKFYIRNLLTVFIPFFLLAYLNARILNILRQQHRSARMFRFAASDHKDKVRSASRTLVLVVFTYLISNVLNVAVTAWEHIDMDSVELQWEFYEWCTDIISVLTVAGCALRLPIYWMCNEEIRLAVESAVRRLPSRIWGAPKQLYNQTQRMTRARKQQHNQIGTEFDTIAVAIACSVMKQHSRLIEFSNAQSRQVSRQNSKQKDADSERRLTIGIDDDDDDDDEEETKAIKLKSGRSLENDSSSAMSALCNDSIGVSLVPTISDYFNGAGPVIVSLTALAGFFTLGTIVLFGAHYIAISKWVTDDERQAALIQLAALFPVTTVLGFIGLCVPRTLTIMKTFVLLFFMRTLFVFAGFVRCLFGGRRKMSQKLLHTSTVISYQSRPCCCCCRCLPSKVQPTERNLALTEWIILQAPVIRFLLIFLALIEISERGGFQRAWVAQASNLLTVVSSLLAMYGCTVLTTVADTYLREYHVAKTFRLLHLNIIVFQLQGGIFELLASFNVIQDDDFLNKQTKTNIYTNVLLSLEMLLISAYVTIAIHPEKNATFDRHPTRPDSNAHLQQPAARSITMSNKRFAYESI